VTEDIEAVLRKIEYWHQGSVAKFKIMCRDSEGFGTGFGGTIKPRLYSLWMKPTSKKPDRKLLEQ
jgi:hypothetical protein